MTSERSLVHYACPKAGIRHRTMEIVTAFDGGTVHHAQVFSGERRKIAARSVAPPTSCATPWDAVMAANEVDAEGGLRIPDGDLGGRWWGAHLLKHCTGWMRGGLTPNFEKLILDAEMGQTKDACFAPIATDPALLALDAMREAGPDGHFFGTAHTMDRYEVAFCSPVISTWDNDPNWLEKGSTDARSRANSV